MNLKQQKLMMLINPSTSWLALGSIDNKETVTVEINGKATADRTEDGMILKL